MCGTSGTVPPAPAARRARRPAKRAGCPNSRTGTTSVDPSTSLEPWQARAGPALGEQVLVVWDRDGDIASVGRSAWSSGWRAIRCVGRWRLERRWLTCADSPECFARLTSMPASAGHGVGERAVSGKHVEEVARVEYEQRRARPGSTVYRDGRVSGYGHAGTGQELAQSLLAPIGGEGGFVRQFNQPRCCSCCHSKSSPGVSDRCPGLLHS